MDRLTELLRPKSLRLGHSHVAQPRRGRCRQAEAIAGILCQAVETALVPTTIRGKAKITSVPMGSRKTS